MTASGFLHSIDACLPRFEVPASQISILNQPAEFFTTLLSGIASARSRIFLCSLYIGTDVPLLVEALRGALRSQPHLSVYILLDGLRGTRPGPDSDGSRTTASVLLPLLHEFGPRVAIRFYHTPSLRGLWKSLVPNRLNEGFGLQHIKLCGFDDQVIVTGANLSGEYFTNRQDRYYQFSSPALTRYFDTLATTLGGFAYLLQSCPTGEPVLVWPQTNHTPLPLEESDPKTIREAAQRHLTPLVWNTTPKEKPSAGDTLVYPLVQLTPLLGRDVNHGTNSTATSTHEWALTRFLALLPYCTSWTLSTPYLCLTPQLKTWLVRVGTLNRSQGQSSGTVIAAAPEAMSFYGAKGIARYIPRAFSDEFHALRRVLTTASDQRSWSPRLLEWRRGTAHAKNGWTFHAKGWWVGGLQAPHGDNKEEKKVDDGLSMTIVGSSNYGERSLKLDLELDVLIVTRDAELKRRIHGEERGILKYGRGGESPGKGGLVEGILVWGLMLLIRLLGLSI